MEYQIIPMTPAQLPQAAALERVCFSHPWTEKALAEDLNNELLTLLAAVGEDGTLLGYGEVRTVLDEGTLERIAVAPQFRRHGAAEALLRRFLDDGREKLAFLTLEVRQSNAPARALYEKLGYLQAGLRRNYYENPREDAIIMTKTL